MEWQALSTQYAIHLDAVLHDLETDSVHYHSHQQRIEDLFPLICGRCWLFSCDLSSSCEWCFRESAASHQLLLQLLEQRRLQVIRKGPCGCKQKKRFSTKQKVCACQLCNRTAASDCDICGRFELGEVATYCVPACPLQKVTPLAEAAGNVAAVWVVMGICCKCRAWSRGLMPC